jgi:hypothetical protein
MRWMRLCLLVLLTGCWSQGQEPPGDPVGTFDAAGLLVEQTCGEAIPAPDPIDLTFELRAEAAGRAYWQRVGGSVFAGVHKDGEYVFQVSQSWTVHEPDPFLGYAGCSVTQHDEFTFVVEEASTAADAGSDDASDGDAGVPSSMTLTGSQTTEITPVTGSDCMPAVVSGGGSFLSLPCRVEYVLTGTGELIP